MTTDRIPARPRAVNGEAGSGENLKHRDRSEAERSERFKLLDQMGEAFKGIPEDEIEREAARAIAEVRAENRQQAQAAATPSG